MSNRVRFSSLKHFAQSPAHYKYWAGREMETTSALRIGTAVHSAVLGGAPVVRYDGTRRGAAWDAFQAAHHGATILNATEYDTAQSAAVALRYDHESAKHILSSIDDRQWVNERYIEWDFNGVPFRSTVDRHYGPDNAATLVELKTTRSARPADFLRDATRRHYHAQVATYRAALATVGVTVARAVIVAVETVPPYCVTVFEVSDRALDIGYRTACSWLEQYKVCAASDEWPGYSMAPIPFDIAEEDELDWSGIEEATDE